jgi:hypothetical protein
VQYSIVTVIISLVQSQKDNIPLYLAIILFLPKGFAPLLSFNRKWRYHKTHYRQECRQTLFAKQTCGKCHDYNKITQGFHFQQGMDENPTAYRPAAPNGFRIRAITAELVFACPVIFLSSDKENTNEKLLDLTSYTFVNKCVFATPVVVRWNTTGTACATIK